MKKNKISFYILNFTFYIIFSGCSTEEKKKEIKSSGVTVAPHVYLDDSQLKLMDIQLSRMEEKLVYPTIYASGIISPKPNHEASVTPRISGMVDNIFVLEGSNVKKGQALMSVSSSELIQMQQDYMSSVVEVIFQQKEFDRQSTLRNSNVGALAEFQLAESKYLNAITIEKTLAEKLKLQGIDPNDIKDPANAKIKSEKILRSPIDGFIYFLPAKVGMRAEPGTILAEIIDLSELRADVYCYEKDLALIRENQEVEIQFINKNIPNAIGKIENISRTIDKETRSIVMHTSFKAPHGYLVMPEMSITAKIKGLNSGKMTKTVPMTAIYDESEQSFIYYSSQPDSTGKYNFRRARVKIGNNDGKNVELEFEQPVPQNAFIAVSNITSIESEFKKQENSK
jgi:cobalt-zinc-cadmium efflux system membrane fusion protein